MNKLLRLAFEAAAVAAAGVVGDQVRKHGPKLIDAAIEKAPEAIEQAKKTCKQIKRRFGRE